MTTPFLSVPAGLGMRPAIVGASLPTDLRAVGPSSTFLSRQRAELPLLTFAWDPTSVAPDDGATVIKPNDIAPIDPGRWVLVGSSTAPAGAGDVHFTLSGEYSAAAVPGFFDPPLYVEAGFALDHVRLMRRTAGTAGQTEIDVLKNGVSIFTALPAITAGAGDNATAVGNAFVLGANVFVPGDYIDVVLVGVETFKAGPPSGPEGLRVTLVKA